MEIEILKDGLWNTDNMTQLKEGDVIDIPEKRAKKAIKNKLAKAVKNKSQQEEIQDNIEKK